MTTDDDLQKTFTDICVLFELTLSIGQSLDLRDNCARFLTTLMTRKNLGFAAVWLYADVMDGQPRPGAAAERMLRLLHGVPLAHLRETTVPATHPAFSGADAGSISFAATDESRKVEACVSDGTYALFPLGALGFLRLFSSAPSRLGCPIERSQLETVVRKFTVSLEGCLAHQRIIGEVARRERLESEREAIAQQLEQAHKMEAIGRLAGGVAHDFNNLLAVIMGHAELLRQRAADGVGAGATIGSAEADLETIVSATERAAQLTGQLLAFSRRGKLRTAPIAVDGLVAEAITLIARTCNPNIVISFERGAGGAEVMGDAAQLQSVILNLLVNACDAMPNGGFLRVSTQLLATPGDETSQVRVSVEDTGIGMDDQVMKRVFEPFFTTKTLGRGTGLGLSVAYGIIQSHGGTITVQSLVGRGTTFAVALPLAPTNQALATVRRDDRQDPTGQGEKILVVDDYDDVRELMGTMLRRVGYLPLLARDGLAALDILEREHQSVRAVLLDVRMPRMDGVETLRRLRGLKPDLPVVIVSGFGAERDLDRLRTMGVQGEVEKPFTAQDLAAALARAIGVQGELRADV